MSGMPAIVGKTASNNSREPRNNTRNRVDTRDSKKCQQQQGHWQKSSASILRQDKFKKTVLSTAGTPATAGPAIAGTSATAGPAIAGTPATGELL
jgi:hypothetical protein